MEPIAYQELVVICEACHSVNKMPIRQYEECLDIFKEFHCPNGCGPNLYSFFTVGHYKK